MGESSIGGARRVGGGVRSSRNVGGAAGTRMAPGRVEDEASSVAGRFAAAASPQSKRLQQLPQPPQQLDSILPQQQLLLQSSSPQLQQQQQKRQKFPPSPTLPSPTHLAALHNGFHGSESDITAPPRTQAAPCSGGAVDPRSRHSSTTVASVISPLPRDGGGGGGSSSCPRLHRSSGSSTPDLSDLVDSFVEERTDRRRKAHLVSLLHQTLRSNGSLLRSCSTSKRAALLEELAESLKTDDWDLALPCIRLLEELIPKLGPESLDALVAPAIPNLVPFLGDKRITVRKNTVQALHVYMRHTRDIDHVFARIVESGLLTKDGQLRHQVMLSLPILLTPEFAHENFYSLVHGLAKMLVGEPSNSEDLLIPTSLMIMEKIRRLVGDDVFSSYLNRMSGALKEYYDKLMRKKRESVNSYTANYEMDHRLEVERIVEDASEGSKGSSLSAEEAAPYLEYGFIPLSLMNSLSDKEHRVRANAVEELKAVLDGVVDFKPVLPFTRQVFSLISNLFEEHHLHLPMVISLLEVQNLFLKKVLSNTASAELALYPDLHLIVSSLAKVMPNNVVEVRKSVVKTFMHITDVLLPQVVLDLLVDLNFGHRNPHVRQSAIDILTVALHSYSTEKIDLMKMTERVGPMLLDPKSRVRQAAMECLCLLASLLKKQEISEKKKRVSISTRFAHAIEKVERNFTETDGLLAAVNARLSRDAQPKLTHEGLIEYGVKLPEDETENIEASEKNADILWIVGRKKEEKLSLSREKTIIDNVLSGQPSMKAISRDNSLSNVASPAKVIRSTGSTASPAARKGNSSFPWDETDKNTQSKNDSSTSSSDKPWRQASFLSRADSVNSINEVRPLKAVSSFHFLEGEVASPTVDDPLPPDQLPPNFPALPKPELKTPTVEANLSLNRSGRGSILLPSHGSMSAPPQCSYPTLPNYPQINSCPNSGSLEAQRKRVERREEMAPLDKEACDSGGGGGAAAPIPTAFSSPLISPFGSRNSLLFEEDSPKPIPTRPMLARSASGKTKQLPPIDLTSFLAARDGSDWETPPTREPTRVMEPRYGERIFEVVGGGGYGGGGGGGEERTPSPYGDKPVSSRVLNVRLSAQRRLHKMFQAAGGVDVAGKSIRSAPNSGRDRKLLSQSLSPSSSPLDLDESGVFSQSAASILAKSPRTPPTPPTPGEIDAEEVDASRKTTPRLAALSAATAATGSASALPAATTAAAPAATLPSKIPRHRIYGKKTAPLNDDEGDDTSRHKLPLLHKEKTEPISVKRRSPRIVAGRNHNNNDEDQSSNDNKQLSNKRAFSEPNMSRVGRGKYSGTTMTTTTTNTTTNSWMSKTDPTENHKLPPVKRNLHGAEKSTPPSMIDAGDALVGVGDAVLASDAGNDLGASKTGNYRRENNNNYSNSGNGWNHNNNNIQRKLAGATSPEKLDRDPSTPSPQKQQQQPQQRPPPHPHPPQRHPTVSVQELAPPDHTVPGFSASGAAVDVEGVELGAGEALNSLASSDWEKKCLGLAGIRRLASAQPESLQASVHSILIAVDAEMKNLRSQVSRAALHCMAVLFAAAPLKKGLETDLEMLSRTLLNKAGESNNFIREDVDRALSSMVEHLSSSRVLAAICAHGLAHKNVGVRRSTAAAVWAVVERLGPGKALKGGRDVTERLLNAAAQLVVDGSQETRFFGKKILHSLMSHPEFDRIVGKTLAAKPANDVRNAVENIVAKGFCGEAASAAAGRRGGSGGRAASVPRNSSRE